MMQTEQLATKNIRQLLLELAIPSIIAQLVNVAYNMVDRIYIGQLANGTKAMAALSVTLPAFTRISSSSSMISSLVVPFKWSSTVSGVNTVLKSILSV